MIFLLATLTQASADDGWVITRGKNPMTDQESVQAIAANHNPDVGGAYLTVACRKGSSTGVMLALDGAVIQDETPTVTFRYGAEPAVKQGKMRRNDNRNVVILGLTGFNSSWVDSTLLDFAKHHNQTLLIEVTNVWSVVDGKTYDRVYQFDLASSDTIMKAMAEECGRSIFK